MMNSHHLRILVEIDGKAVVDRDVEVWSVNTSLHNGVTDISSENWRQWELDGSHELKVNWSEAKKVED